ncbi:cylicin-2-like [Drosophila suzukii]|uniref:Cylicin-2-like n=1 Tax=Drosophila suzukii TaxID=28584 RepID=A0ABM4TXD2_DROSZ
MGTPTPTWNFLENTKNPVETLRATTSTNRRHYKIVRHETKTTERPRETVGTGRPTETPEEKANKLIEIFKIVRRNQEKASQDQARHYNLRRRQWTPKYKDISKDAQRIPRKESKDTSKDSQKIRRKDSKDVSKDAQSRLRKESKNTSKDSQRALRKKSKETFKDARRILRKEILRTHSKDTSKDAKGILFVPKGTQHDHTQQIKQ